MEGIKLNLVVGLKLFPGALFIQDARIFAIKIFKKMPVQQSIIHELSVC